LKFCISSSDYIVRASTTLVRRKTLGEKREREHRLIYINNRLAPELEWFDVELARHLAELEVEVSL
jgi:hypothetical protein